MSMSSESDVMMALIGGESPPTVEEATAGGNIREGSLLKKGPWTSAEDAMLVEYVTKYGEGNWNSVQKHSALARCGKSCRLRWANHLRPDLKKGAFTPEEELRIAELHYKMGNKWARMAAELPGRTDNEIKNYWNTRVKRRLRAGLPLYPPELCFKATNVSQQNEDMGTYSPGDMHHPDISQMNNFEIPALDFKGLELNTGHSYPPAVLDIPPSYFLDPASTLLGQGHKPACGNGYFHSTVHPSKRFRGSETLFPGFGANASDLLPVCNRFQSGSAAYVAQPFGGYSSAYDHQNLGSNHPSLFDVVPGSHASLNGNNSCSSDPLLEKKLELPSLQSQIIGSWYSPPSPLPSLESIDTLIQSPPTESNRLSQRNSGLLDAVLYEAQALKHSKNISSQMDNSSPDLHETECEAYRDPISPLGHSSASVLSSLDEPPPVETVTGGCNIKQERVDLIPKQCDGGECDESNQNIFSRPDMLLASNCYSPQTDYIKNHSLPKEVFETVLFDDFSRDCKKMRVMAATSSGGCAGGSCAWDDTMSAVQSIDS